MGLMLLALKDGVPETARAHCLPETTLRTWLQEFGGVVEIRRWLEQETMDSYLRAQRAILDRVAQQAPNLSDGELMVTYRAMLAARAQSGSAAAQANATVINVTIPDE